MKKSVVLLSFAIATTVLTGQAWADQQRSDNRAITVQQQYNPYEVAGIDDPVEFTTYFSKLQKEVAANNKTAVADMISYPLRVNSGGKSIEIKSKQQFIAKYKKIMTNKVKKQLLAQKVDDVFVNWKGVMIGNGEIWIGKFDKKIAIFAINK